MGNFQDVFLIDGIRTPFVKSSKNFSKVHASNLAAYNLKELVFRIGLDGKDIDEVIIGNVGNPSDAVNISRVAVLKAGLPKEISAMTVHRNCASSLESVASAFAKIRSGMLSSVIAGGVENMSQAPFLLQDDLRELLSEIFVSKSVKDKIKKILKFKLKFLVPRISLIEALKDPIVGINMGQTAEILAKEFSISREEQDDFAINSHLKAINGNYRLKEEMFPVFAKPDFQAVTEDIGPRRNPDPERMAKMKPYFDRKYGTITIANSCSITDGSAMNLLLSEEKMGDLGLKPLAKIRAIGFAALEPERMGLGPVYAVAKVLKKSGLSLKDIGLVEINEAFAAQVLACLKAFNSDHFARKNLGMDKALGEISIDCLNVNGGAIAIGHPVGATGSRLILTLAKEMKRREIQFGLASLCIGGGQGGAVILENMN